MLKDKKTNQTRIKCGSPMIVLSAIFSGDVIDCVSFWRMSQFSDLGIVGTSLADLRFFFKLIYYKIFQMVLNSLVDQ